MPIHTISSQKFTITVTTPETCYALALIGFLNDGSVHISFPYYRNAYGWVGLNRVPGDGNRTHTINLQDQAAITSHLVKFSYHTDGVALFSQDGKVYSRVRKNTVPLCQLNGQLAIIQAQGLSGFTTIGNIAKYSASKKRCILNFISPSIENDCIKITFFYYSHDETERRMPQGGGPQISSIDPQGNILNGFLISSPPEYPLSSSIIVIHSGITPRFADHEPSMVTLLGGFDKRTITLDRSLPTTFLYLAYPVTNYDLISRTVGSIDYIT